MRGNRDQVRIVRRSPNARRALIGTLFAAGAVTYLLAIRFAPALLAGTQPTPDAQLTAEQNARVTVTSAGAALAVAAGLLFTAFNYRLARRGHTAGQVTTALTQLGGTELYVRVGAIRALEALVRESRDDRVAILEVLASFVRHRAPRKPEPGPPAAYQPDLPGRPAPDIQAALTVLCQHGARNGHVPDLRDLYLVHADLSGAQLTGADLRGACLDHADFRGANLTAADLRDTSLRFADLGGARLDQARLDRSDLTDATLRRAELNSARLPDAVLERADLEHAQARSANLQAATLTGAKLWAAALPGANLVGADLDRADLRHANLEGANLYQATLSRADVNPANLLDANLESATVWRAKLPDGFDADQAAVVSKQPLKRSKFTTWRTGPRNLVICCDGSWGGQGQTNVTRIARAVAGTSSDGAMQLTFHQRCRTSGSRAAVELDVLDTYRLLVQNFRPGDRLYFFGFSRGAYVTRTVVGMISAVGILRREHADRVDEAYALYRTRSRHTPRSFTAIDFRHSYAFETEVKFVGVWETVGPLGIPAGRLRLADPRWRRLMFHDTAMSQIVDAACQALAIDEHRRNLPPALWRRSPGVEQVWFPGSHADVGGGFADNRLAGLSLRWMMKKATEQGLAFRDAPIEADPLGTLHASLSATRRFRGVSIRPIGEFEPPTEQVSDAARVRMAAMADYQPVNLVRYRATHAEP
ncbi:phospholipase effector Tle1 domain-containing protein [Amycolatopsis sp. lyj-109]|uniref:phospholipase effector Tle1 domain-containing protein n=1 Tax=Amycolatopsis sp. lyj-109 TaxID=2789287 RepID=UPI00397D848F